MSEVAQLGAKGRRPRRNGGKGQPSKSEERSVEETSPDDEPEDPTEVANQIAAETDCELILYNGPIDSTGFGKIIELVPSLNPDKNGCILVLVTYGGDAEQAYRIARLMQDVFKPFIVFVPGPCKSAGTLLATGAHYMIIAPHIGELGPLDVQLYKRDELGERQSGLVTRAAIESLGEHALELYSTIMLGIKTRSSNLVRFKTATDVAAMMASRLLSQVYDKIDPEIVANEQRDMEVAFNYACRLAKKGGNIDNGNIHHLVYNYPSHDFLIDFEEASGIFKRVQPAPMPLMRLVAALGVELKPSPQVTVRRLSTLASDAAADAGGVDEQGHEDQQTQEAAAD